MMRDERVALPGASLSTKGDYKCADSKAMEIYSKMMHCCRMNTLNEIQMKIMMHENGI